MADIDKLEALAREAKHLGNANALWGYKASLAALHFALSPSVVLELVREARRAQAMRDAIEWHLKSLDDWPDGDLVPINRSRGTVRGLRAAIGEQGKG